MNAAKVVPASRGVVSASRRGYILTAVVLLAVMAGGTLPVPLYVLYEQQMGFGPLGVTVVFAAYVVGTLFALVAFGDLSDHIGRRRLRPSPSSCEASAPRRPPNRRAHPVTPGARRRNQPAGARAEYRWRPAGNCPAARATDVSRRPPWGGQRCRPS
jgi:hypothetical protein